MPLAFPSTSHGVIAFGFFNIETDMLLLRTCSSLLIVFVTLLLSLRSQSEKTEADVWMDGLPDKGSGHDG